MPARGWSVYTTKGKSKSDEYADIFYKHAKLLLPTYNMTLRQDLSDGDYDWEENYTILYKSWCPAVLTENLFQDNKIDCSFLMTEQGRDVITQIHVNAINEIKNLHK
jgi:N-acetylmuramoyl-L-alanine amidase